MRANTKGRDERALVARRWTLPRRHTSSFQEIRIDRQGPDALAGRREDGVADGGRDRRDAWFADPGGRRAAFDDVDVRLRRDVGARDQVVGEVALLDPALLGGHAAVERVADGHDRRALELRAHTVGVDDQSAIEGKVDPRDRDLSVIAD